MSDVDVRLRDGKLVGVDPDTGETVELPLGDTNHDDIVSDSLTTERAGITEVSEQPTEGELAVGFYSLNGQLIARTED